MRIFILKSNTACLENVNIKSPASSGRFDVVLDFILECLYTSSEARRDTKIYIVLAGCRPVKTILVDGVEIPYFENERELLEYMLKNSKSGIHVLDIDFEKLLDMLISEGYRLYCLYEYGVDIDSVDIECRDIAFIIGDQDGFTQEDLQVMKSRNIEFISIGPIPYLSWFCCTFIQYYLDSICRS